MPGSSPADSEWTPAATRDRFSSTLFLAALVHGIIILGVSFTAGPLGGPAPTSLEVVIVSGDSRPQADPEARLIAQQNLAGAGNTREDVTLRTAPGQSLPPPLAGPARDGSEQPSDSAITQAGSMPATLVTAGNSVPLAEAGLPEPQPELRRNLEADVATDLVGRIDSQTLVQGQAARELLVSANTRESSVAPYLSSWKRRVEQVGTLNFPRQVPRRADAASPVLEVAIGADGQLRGAVIRRSSGYRDLDQAAIDILRAAGPFQAFPDSLRGEYDVLRFAYEWHFTEGAGSLHTAAGR
jgi:protein TonB